MKHRIFLYLILMFLLPVVAQADTKKIEGTTNVEDARYISTSADHRCGALTNFIVATTTNVSAIRVKNVASELGVGATITACVCSIYVSTNTADGDIYAYQILKPWFEGDDAYVSCDGLSDDASTWNDWSCLNMEWTGAGCSSADDGGSDNSGDGTGADRKATPEDTENVTTVNTWYAWNISTTLAQGWYDGTINEEGILLVSDGTASNVFVSTEGASNQPFFVFTYTTDGEPPAGQVIIIGARYEEDYHNPRFVCPDLGR